MKLVFKLIRICNGSSTGNLFLLTFFYRLFLMTSSLYSSTAYSAEGIMFIMTDGNPLWVMILCIVKKKKTTSTFAIIYDSFHSDKVMGHVPLYGSELANKMLSFSNHHILVAVTGKRVNRGIGLD